LYLFPRLDSRNRAISTIEVFNIVTHSWSILKTKLEAPRVGCSALSVENRLYIFGGHTEVGVYDTKTKRWSSFPDCVDEIYSLSSVNFIGKDIYVVGGITQKSILESVRIYNLQTKRWTDHKSDKFFGGFVHVAAFPNETEDIILFGTMEDHPTDTIVVHNPLEMRVSTQMPPMKTKRVGCALVRVQDTLYAIGGHDGVRGPLSSMEIYALSSCKRNVTSYKTHIHSSQDEEDGNFCVICLESQRSFAFVPCGHLSLCEECANAYPRSMHDLACAICRGQSTFLMKVYN